MEEDSPTKKASSLRWKILRRALLRRPSPDSDQQSETGIEYISRKAKKGFNLIPCHLIDGQIEGSSDSCSNANRSISSREACVCYTLPVEHGACKLLLYQRMDNCADLDDFKICNTYDIDNTGLVCPWPSEEVLAFYCLSHVDKFRSKRVIELGSGYGLAGLVIAVATEALEVVISDGNPQVVDCILFCWLCWKFSFL